MLKSGYISVVSSKALDPKLEFDNNFHKVDITVDIRTSAHSDILKEPALLSVDQVMVNLVDRVTIR